jgi:hypothetical protein
MIRNPSLWPRRTWLELLLKGIPAAALVGRSTASPLSLIENVLKETAASPVQAVQRRYRADVVILLFNMPIFSRSAVGGAQMMVESVQSGDINAVALQFAAGSAPSRARGLNRLGFFEEVVTERGSTPVETAYFGFMTSSKEQSFAQAKKAMENSGGNLVPYTAAKGSSAKEKAHFSVHQLELTSKLTFSDTNELISKVRTALEANENVVQKGEVKPGQEGTPRTFLHSIRRAILSPETTSESKIIHTGKPLRIRTVRQRDEKAGEQFLEKGLVKSAGNVWKLDGEVRDAKGKDPGHFRLWFDQTDTTGMPLRFEFRPKSFLKIAFELDPKVEGPGLRQVIRRNPQA